MFDVYLELLHRVDGLVNDALGHNTADWRMRNSCPTCEYRLADELCLRFSKLLAMDGNNSLRWVDPMVTKNFVPLMDTCRATSDIWLSPQQVDVFKDEVKARKPSVPAQPPVSKGVQVCLQ